MHERRLTETSSGVGHDLGILVAGQWDHSGVAIGGELHSVQVVVHDLGEHVLAVTDNDELPSTACLSGVALLLREVVEHLRTVRVERLGRKSVGQTELSPQPVEGRSDALQRYTRTPDHGQDQALGEPDEWDNSRTSGLAGHSGHDGGATLLALRPPRECGLGKAKIVPRLAQAVERRLKSINISHPQQPLSPTSAGSLTSGGGLPARRSKTVQDGPR